MKEGFFGFIPIFLVILIPYILFQPVCLILAKLCNVTTMIVVFFSPMFHFGHKYNYQKVFPLSHPWRKKKKK